MLISIELYKVRILVRIDTREEEDIFYDKGFNQDFMDCVIRARTQVKIIYYGL